ncbi:hypothetical protein ACFQY7_11370 [Actinomadura luteofluorescens]|uniref:hypothetical protein n=1 Tax=Actinomadura luteofluorescens TaxID=46163 RepID=UPI00363A6F69
MSGADRSSTASTVMYERTSGTARWLGIVTTSAMLNSPMTGRTPIGSGNVHFNEGSVSWWYSSFPPVWRTLCPSRRSWETAPAARVPAVGCQLLSP